MANIPLKTMNFEGLDNTYTIPESFNDLNGSLSVDKISGVLPVSKGGTGTNSVDSLKEVLDVPSVDNTLSISGDAADAKAVGDKLKATEHVYNTVEEMKSDSELSEGEACETLYYRTNNDFGGALYLIVSDNSSSSFHYEELDNGLYARLIFDRAVNVKQLGAWGDDDHDDTDIFKEALNYSYDVYVPTARGEKYKITDTLVLKKDHIKRMFGDGTWRSGGTSTWGGLHWTITDNTIPMFECQVEMFHFANLGFTGAAGIEGLFFKADNDAMDVDVEFNNCSISNFRYGSDFTGRGLTVINSAVNKVRYVAKLNWDEDREAGTTHPAKYGQRAIRFANNRFHHIYSQFFNFESGHAYGFMFSDNLIDNGAGQFISAEDELWGISICNNIFNGMDNNGSMFVFKDGIKDSLISSNVITTYSDYWTGNSSFTNIFSINSCENLSIVNNVCTNATRFILLNDSISGLTIANNSCTELEREFVRFRTDESRAISITNCLIIGNRGRLKDASVASTRHFAQGVGTAITATKSYCEYNSIGNFPSISENVTFAA